MVRKVRRNDMKENNELLASAKFTSKGQITIPKIVRETLNIEEGDSVVFYLDEKKNIIHIDKSIANAKYLSDITFSSNDYCLNTLLNILPKKIHIHLLNNGKGTEFLDTLCAIFGKRIIICLDCNICNFYKANDILKKNN